MSNYFDNKELFTNPKVSQYNSHMVMTNVHKDTKHKFINIDSKFCDDYANNRLDSSKPSFNIANYTYTLPERITNVKSIRIRNIEVPITFYNISASKGNNYFKIYTSSNSYIITVPDGEYTATTLETALTTLLSSYNLKYNYTDTYYSQFYLSSAGTTFYVDFAVDASGNSDKYKFKSKLGWLLGFRNTTYTVSTTSGIYSETIVNLNSDKYLYLTIDEFSKGNQNSFISPLSTSLINKNIIAKITLNKQVYPFGTVLPANEHIGFLMSDKRTYNGKIDIQKINYKLINDLGEPINLNDVDFSFGMEIEYE